MSCPRTNRQTTDTLGWSKSQQSTRSPHPLHHGSTGRIQDPHRTIDAALDAAGQADALVQYNAYKKVYVPQENVRRTVINALNVAVPQAYRRLEGGGLGVRNYRPTDSPMAILASLRRLYGRLTPTERTGMEAFTY